MNSQAGKEVNELNQLYRLNIDVYRLHTTDFNQWKALRNDASFRELMNYVEDLFTRGCLIRKRQADAYFKAVNDETNRHISSQLALGFANDMLICIANCLLHLENIVS